MYQSNITIDNIRNLVALVQGDKASAQNNLMAIFSFIIYVHNRDKNKLMSFEEYIDPVMNYTIIGLFENVPNSEPQTLSLAFSIS